MEALEQLRAAFTEASYENQQMNGDQAGQGNQERSSPSSSQGQRGRPVSQSPNLGEGQPGDNEDGSNPRDKKRDRNRLAQQRYREKRKVQFETAVELLDKEIHAKKDLQSEVIRLQRALAMALTAPTGVTTTPPKLTIAAIDSQIMIFQQKLRMFAHTHQLESWVPTKASDWGEIDAIITRGINLLSQAFDTIITSASPPKESLSMWFVQDESIWITIVSIVNLTAQQIADIGVWKDQVLHSIDSVYGERLLIKAQMLSTNGDMLNQWPEIGMLELASSSGLSHSAQELCRLDSLRSSLEKSIAREKAIVKEAIFHLLKTILTPLQSIKYLLASLPFGWNTLAFAHKAASRQSSFSR